MIDPQVAIYERRDAQVNKQLKEKRVQELKDTLSEKRSAILLDYRGLKVEEINALRNRLKEADTQFFVIKNTLAKRAFKGTEFEKLSERLTGPNALAAIKHDPVSPAKLIREFIKEHETVQLKAALVEGDMLEAKDIQFLATLPSKEELLTQTVRAMQAPITGFVRILNGFTANLVNVLSRIKEQKENA